MCGQREVSGGQPDHPVGPPGVVLVITLLLVGLVMVMPTTMINLSSSDYMVATNESRSIQALFNADAGTEEAKMRVSPNAPTGVGIPIGTSKDWRAYILSGTTQAQVQGGMDPTYGKAAPDYMTSEGTSNYTYFNTVQTGPNAIQWGWARIEHLIDAGGNIVYQDVVTGKATTVDSYMVGGTTVFNQPMLVVTAEGIQGSVRRMISPNYRPIVSPPPFKNAIHAKDKVELVGNAWTDSYDSSKGAYDPNACKSVTCKGQVSTDSIAAGAIYLEPNTYIDGMAIVGPGGNPAVAIVNNGGTIESGTAVEPAAQDLSLSDIPDNCDNQGPLTVAGSSTRTLTTGCYVFSSIIITGNGQLIIPKDTAVRIYVTGNIDIGGNGILNTSNLPTNLLIYGSQDTKNVKIHGNGDFYGAVFAPEAAIDVYGNGATFGSVVGKTAKINGNGGFHYDENLANLNGTLMGFTQYS
jgi:hypothetical protein